MLTKTEIVLLLVIVGLMVERIFLGRRLGNALDKIGLLQRDLFGALHESYKRVAHSHSMVMRCMRVMEAQLGIEAQELDHEDPEWPGVVGGGGEEKELDGKG